MTKAKANIVTEDTFKSEEGKPTAPSITKSELDSLKAKAQEAESLKADKEVVDTEKAKLELELEELRKAKEELDTLKADQEAKVLTDTVDVVKGFNLFPEDNAEDVAKFFVANAGDEVNLILETLEKARTAIKEFGESEHGSDHEGVTTDLSKSEQEVAALGASVLDIIKARKNEK